MNKSSPKKLAESMNISEDVLPYYHELLKDLWALGSFPHRIAEALKPLILSIEQPRILDLGCGKGAAGITLAKEFDAQVDGYDQFKPFLDEAIQKADEHGVSDRCRFELADINDVVLKARDYDVVTLASVGAIGGNLEQTVASLRQTVRSGGYIVIDDCFARGNEKIDFVGYGYIAAHDECIEQLTAHGDRLVHESIVPIDDVIAQNEYNNEAIARRAAELTKRYPDKAKVFANFVQREKDECVVIETRLVAAIWILQKS